MKTYMHDIDARRKKLSLWAPGDKAMMTRFKFKYKFEKP
jgi:hypothetical protein